MRKLVQDGIAGGVYELTYQANGCLSEWIVGDVIVDKVKNSKPEDEFWMRFDSSHGFADKPAP